MTTRKSPYLILGVPYGASKTDAARAFAKAARRIRRMMDPPYDFEDLNWALHAIEQRSDDPALSIDDYRMPANESVYEIPDGEGLLNPPVKRYPRLTKPTDPETVERLKSLVRSQVAQRIAEEWQKSPLPPIHRFPE